MKCTIKFSNDKYVTVEAEDQEKAIAFARMKLIKQGDKEWNLHAIKSIKWSV